MTKTLEQIWTDFDSKLPIGAKLEITLEKGLELRHNNNSGRREIMNIENPSPETPNEKLSVVLKGYKLNGTDDPTIRFKELGVESYFDLKFSQLDDYQVIKKNRS